MSSKIANCSVLMAMLLVGQFGCSPAEEPSQSSQPPPPARAKSSTLTIKLDPNGPDIRANVGRLEQTATPPTVVLGRAFEAEEHHAGNSRVVLISNKFWTEQMASQPDAIGRELLLGGQPRVIVGVLATDVAVNPDVDVWMPLSSESGAAQ